MAADNAAGLEGMGEERYLAEWEWRVLTRDAEADWAGFQCRGLDQALRTYRDASADLAAKVDALMTAKNQNAVDTEQAQDEVYAASQAAETEMSTIRDKCRRTFPVPAPGPLAEDLASAPGDEVPFPGPPSTAEEARRRWQDADATETRMIRERNAVRSEPSGRDLFRRAAQLARDGSRAAVAKSDASAAWYASACPTLAARYAEFRRLAEQEHRLLGSLAPLQVAQEAHDAAVMANPYARPPHEEETLRHGRLASYVERLRRARHAAERGIREACPQASFGG